MKARPPSSIPGCVVHFLLHSILKLLKFSENFVTFQLFDVNFELLKTLKTLILFQPFEKCTRCSFALRLLGQLEREITLFNSYTVLWLVAEMPSGA